MPGGTEIDVRFSVAPLSVLIFIGVFLFFEYLVFTKELAPHWEAPIYWLAFIHLASYFAGFVPEQKWAERRLREVLDA